MNKDNAKDFLPFVQALVDRKTIQTHFRDGWQDVSELDFCLCSTRYRIKPEPKTVPLGPEDVPPGSCVRCNIDPDSDWCLVHNVSKRGVMVATDAEEIITVSWERLFLDSSMKRPGEDWKPCSKTIEE